MKKLRPIFLASFFFSIHLALLTYVNASMLERLVSPELLSVVYIIASALSLVLIFVAPGIIGSLGLIRFTASLFLISALLLGIIGLGHSAYVIVPIFICYFSLNTLVIYVIDLLVEHYSPEKSTGNTRGLLLSLNSIGWVISPFISGYVITNFGFQVPYILACLMVSLTLLIIVFTQRKFKDRAYKSHSFIQSYTVLKRSPALRRIISINFLLQFFFVWMVLYMPLYLTQALGFSWSRLGVLFTVMLIPFVILEAPVGKLVDKYDERPFILAGFGIMALTTFLFAILGDAPFIIYALTLFGTRVGASILEVSTESYFFKRLNDQDSAMISMYRNMIPIAYIIGPLLGVIILFIWSYQVLFFCLAVILCVAIRYAFRLYKL